MLMIVSVCLPMMGAFDAPPAELELEPARSETPPSPCLGYDACRGSDAGSDTNSAMNLTDDFAFNGEEVNSYYGVMNASAYSSPGGDEHNDVYLIDMQPGYGFTVEVNWNISAQPSSTAYYVAIGPADGSMSWIAWSGSGSWGRCYSSSTGHIGMSSDGDTSYCDGYTYVYDGDFPVDVMGESVLAWVWCGNCYSYALQDYQLNITIWPSDGGIKGDTESPQYSQLLSMPDDPASWSYQSGTFNLDGSQAADVVITSCDTWCTSESSVDVTKPDGTSDSFNLVNLQTGAIATYSDAGTYTVEKIDTFGDGGFGLTVGWLLGNFSGLLTVDDFNFEDAASGHVDQSDTSDVYAIYLPENFFANLTLHWESSADLDLQLYTDYDTATGLSGMFAYSWFDQPEYIDLGQLGDATTIFAEIVHYGGPAAGYILELQTQPGAPPPCFFQDDGAAPGSFSGGGFDAADGAYTPDEVPIDVTGHMDSDGNGAFTGMVCAGFDTEDWFQVTVPAYHGMWASLEWPEGIDSNFNDTIEISGDISFGQYMLTPTGAQYFVSSSYGFHPQAVATNESYNWNNYLDQDSVVYLRMQVNDMTADYESNYTVKYAVYNATVEPWESINQNDAMQGIDAGDGYLEPINMTTMNQTFDGYGHDSWDMYDFYKVYVPPNYAMEVCTSFPAQNDVDLNLFALHPVYGYMVFVDSSFNDNPECTYSQYDDANQDIYIRIHTDRGSGPYSVSIGLLTPGLAPGDTQDDCGTGLDANEAYWTAGYSSYFFVNDSDQADLNPYNANGTTRDYWAGGVCTGWMDGTWDPEDIVDIAVPNGHYASINTTIVDENPNTFWEVYIIMSPTQHQPASASNGYYFAGPQCTGAPVNGVFECEQQSGLWPVGQNTINGNPGWITMFMRAWSSQNASWSLDINFLPLSGLEGGTQNDANSGLDAGSTIWTTIHANDFMNQTQTEHLNNTSTLSFMGWSHGGIDDTDRYTFDVPINHGVLYEMECYDCDGYMILDIYDGAGMYVGYGGATFGGYLSFNTSSYVTNVASTLGVGIRNWFGYDDDGDTYYVNLTFYSLDSDGDGWTDDMEWECAAGMDGTVGTADDGTGDPYDANVTPIDTDDDGICDGLDPDIDGDGVGNDLDEMPMDENGTSDMDGDGIEDALDEDMDGDGWLNIIEQICLGTASLADHDGNVTPSDYDNDTLCDIVAESEVDHGLASTYLDMDGDNDGTNDEDDAFDFDECADTDTDRDEMPDSINTGLLDSSNNTVCVPNTPTNLIVDDDDDNDGHLDQYEIDCGSNPIAAEDMPLDSDSDGECDEKDTDDDNDGHPDPACVGNASGLDYVDCATSDEDTFPYNSAEWSDSDEDRIGDNSDMDDDNDGWWDSCDAQDWLDAQAVTQIEGNNYFPSTDDGLASNCPGQTDAFPNDATEWVDTDGDGVGDNADPDDDNDGWIDTDEHACGTDSLSSASVPLDSDGDGDCDIVDTDDDGDGIADLDDAFPLNIAETVDTDGDGTGDLADADDDNDGWGDGKEVDCLTDPLDSFDVPTDNDGDNICDLNDDDDDADGIFDDYDAFPFNPLETEDTDGDGIGDNSDNDDDGDGWLDFEEVSCAAAGGTGDKDESTETPSDADGDGICDATDVDDDNDGHVDPACVGSASTLTYVDCAVGDEDRFPRDSTEWYDANKDQQGDNANPVTLIDNIEGEPGPYLAIVAVIGALGYGLLQMSQRAGSGTEDEAEDYTEEFEDFDFEDDEIEEDDDDEKED
jgi:hypothetical protein